MLLAKRKKIVKSDHEQIFIFQKQTLLSQSIHCHQFESCLRHRGENNSWKFADFSLWQKSKMVTLKRKCHNSLVVVQFCMPCNFCHRYVDTLPFSFWELHFYVHSVISKYVISSITIFGIKWSIFKDLLNENASFPSITSSAESSSTTMQCPQVWGKDCFAKSKKQKKKTTFS